MNENYTPWKVASGLLAFAFLASLGGNYYLFDRSSTQRKNFAESARIYEENILALKTGLASAQDENAELLLDLEREEERNDEFQETIEDISGTVGTLEKLSKIDPELLQKYSKVYFLNEHYVPPRLTSIDTKFRSDASRSMQVHAEVWPNLEDLLEKAEDADIELQIASAYRSFGTQAALKAGYEVTYGTGANAFSADQGYSEHQLGTAVDFTTPSQSGALNGFDQTPAYGWLLANAYRYGFILSYPSGNSYYQFEPWHWRFVGLDLARDLHRQDENFYDADQREIDKYLVKIFD